MAKTVAIIQGHPDPAGGHLCHALADAYAEGAIAAGHGVSRIDIAHVDFPLLHSQTEYESGAVPDALLPARDAIIAAHHIVLVFPLWLGTMPALVKAFLEQVLRPGIAFAYQPKGLPKKLLAGRSAHVVVTMGMPALVYRLFYSGHGVNGLRRSILNFVGIKPVRQTLLGPVDTARSKGWIDRMRECGKHLT